jgi:hypothetical protein
MSTIANFPRLLNSLDTDAVRRVNLNIFIYLHHLLNVLVQIANKMGLQGGG